MASWVWPYLRRLRKFEGLRVTLEAQFFRSLLPARQTAYFGIIAVWHDDLASCQVDFSEFSALCAAKWVKFILK